MGAAATALTLAIARHALEWRRAAETLRALLPSCQLTIKLPEGYAYYAVSPQAYRRAAEPLRGQIGAVIGLRSIGTSLAAWSRRGQEPSVYSACGQLVIHSSETRLDW